MKEKADEEPDVVLVAVGNQASQPEAYDADLILAPQKRRRWRNAASEQTVALCEAVGKSMAELRMPGSSQRSNQHEGPQRKLALCIWMQKIHEDIGGSDEASELVVGAVAGEWGVDRPEVVRIYKDRARWQEECDERGVTAYGTRKDEAHLPRFLRKSKHCI